MISRHRILLVSGLVAIAAVGVAIAAWRAQRDDETALAAAVRNQTQLQAAVGRASQRADAAERERRALLAKLAAPAAKNRPISKGGAPTDMGAAMMNDPKVQAAYFASQRPRLRLRYGALIQALGLTPDQTDQFIRNAIKRDEGMLDLMATARAQHLAPNDPSIADLAKQVSADYQAAQTGLLGPAGYSQAADFDRTAGIRSLVDTVAGQLALSGEPLTAQQAQQLVQATAGTIPANGRGPNVGPGTVDWDAALANVQAQGILSPTQYTAYAGAAQAAQIGPKIIGLLQKSAPGP